MVLISQVSAFKVSMWRGNDGIRRAGVIRINNEKMIAQKLAHQQLVRRRRTVACIRLGLC